MSRRIRRCPGPSLLPWCRSLGHHQSHDGTDNLVVLMRRHHLICPNPWGMSMRAELVRWTALGVSLPMLLGAWEAERNLDDFWQAVSCINPLAQIGPIGQVIVGTPARLTPWPMSPCRDSPFEHLPLSLATTATGPSSGSPVAFTVWDTVADEPRTGPLIWPQGTAQGGHPTAMRVAIDRLPYWADPSSGHHAGRPSLATQLLAASSLASLRQPSASSQALTVYSASAPWWCDST
jgi:hypothetical protein